MQKAPGGTCCSPEFGMELRHLISISSHQLPAQETERQVSGASPPTATLTFDRWRGDSHLGLSASPWKRSLLGSCYEWRMCLWHPC